MTELKELEMIYCDMHKDVYGVKARWAKFDSIEQARAALDALSESLKLEMAAEAQAQANAAIAVEARIVDLIAMGAKTRADALRWLHDAEDTQGDDDYLCYSLGLPYGYFKR